MSNHKNELRDYVIGVVDCEMYSGWAVSFSHVNQRLHSLKKNAYLLTLKGLSES